MVASSIQVASDSLFLIAMILFGGGLAMGILTGRCSWLPVGFACALAGLICFFSTDWAGYEDAFAGPSSPPYTVVTILGYFLPFVGPAMVGAVIGILIRRSCSRKQQQNTADGTVD